MAEAHGTSDPGSTRSLSDSSSDLEFQPTRSNTYRSRRLSRSGSAASRARSGSRASSHNDIHRVTSGRFMDDQSAYYTEYNPTRRSSEGSELDGEYVDSGNEKGLNSVAAVRGGTANQRDVDLEAAQGTQSNLEISRTRKSERSQYDSTLVCRSIPAYIVSLANGVGNLGWPR